LLTLARAPAIRPPSLPTDPELARAALDRLILLLKTFDGAALDCFSKNIEQLLPMLGPIQMQDIEQQITSYDFDSAPLSLPALRAKGCPAP
jgi:hypothetical protein